MTESRRTLLIIIAGILGLMAFAVVVSLPKHHDREVHVYMLNIGQGDSFLIVAADGKKLLIDGGRDTTVLSELSKVLSLGDTTIDVVIATHPDADHIGGLQYVLERYHVGLFLTSQVQTDTNTFTALYKELAKEHITSYYARRGMVITLDAIHKTTFTILFPDRDTTNWVTNAASVVGKLNVYPIEGADAGSAHSILFTGDSPSSIEHFLVQNDAEDLKSDVLKLGHHGSKYSSSTEYLQTVHPVLGLVSAGVNNRYGHPNVETLARLKVLQIPWVSTQQKGTVELSTDGSHQWIWKSFK